MRGPYVFDQIQHRELLNHVNGTVKYKTYRTHFFNENKSCSECFLYNRIWVPNIIFQKFVEISSKPATRAASSALLIQKPFLEVEVAEFLFDGYVDGFLDQVCSIPFVNLICETILDLPERIGLFYGTNGTSVGTFVADSGETNGGANIGDIHTFNGWSILPDYWWNTEEARQINGTDGSLLPPYLTKDTKLQVYVTDICRSVELTFEKEVTYKGVTAYRFVIGPDAFNMSLPKNRGFCNANGKQIFEQNEDNECLPPGLLDISRCQIGEPPIAISWPNFLHAPDYVQDSIKGMLEPSAERDQVQMDIEPRLGVILIAQRRSQVNLVMWKGENLTMPGLDLSRLRNSIIPMIAINELYEIDEPTLELIKSQLIRTESLVRSSCVIGALIAAFLFLLVLFFILLKSGRLESIRKQLGMSSPNSRIAPNPEK
uniref:Uncharacterized protein n=1 Tax=Acrobeloides nanus TaxID=290746 RepID=A0A914DWG1_9BILA